MNTRELLKKLTNQQILTTLKATVKAVDESAGTIDCQLLDDDQDVFEVKINAALNPLKGFRIIPTVDSIVYISFLNESNTEAFISLYGEVDKVLIDCDVITLNGGSNDGLVNIVDLVDKINTIEDDLNDLKAVFTAFTPIPSDGGAALKTGAASWASATITNTSKANLEDTKITH